MVLAMLQSGHHATEALGDAAPPLASTHAALPGVTLGTVELIIAEGLAMCGAGSKSASIALGFIVCFATSAAFAETAEERLTRLSIKFTKDDDGHIVAVELPERSVDATIEAIVDIPTITSVKAVDCRASVDGFRLLGRMPALRALDLMGSLTPEAHARWLAHVPALESVSITHCRLTNTGLEALCRSRPNLKELDISSTLVTTDTAIRLISEELRELESLTMNRLFRDERTDHLSPTRPVQFSQLASLPRVKRLQVDGFFKIESQQLYAFGCCRHLEKLSLDHYDIEGDADSLIYLDDCNPSLDLLPLIAKKLGIFCSRYQGEVWLTRVPHSRLVNLPQRYLADVTKCEIVKPPDLALLEQMPKLKVLRVFQPQFEQEELRKLQSAPHLQEVDISGGTIDLATVELLLEMRSLTHIGFHNCMFSDEASSLIRRDYSVGRIVVQPSSALKAMSIHPQRHQPLAIPVPDLHR
jgi:hypothetical protein